MNKLNDELELLSKPGDTIFETIEHIKMTQTELAERMGKTPSKINDIISGKEPITVATAFQLEKVLGIDAQFWLNREMLYREKLSRIEEEKVLEQCKDWLKVQPIKELKECGYIRAQKADHLMVEEFLKFYGVASPIQWEALYVEQYALVNFRKSEAYKSKLGALAAWLRIGEIEMRKFKLSTYNKDVFKENLIEIKNLIRHHPEDFAAQLQRYCIGAGVALVYTICIPQAPISAATRWIGGNPLIQLTDRYKTNDQFWFTFLHEVGHIFLHGKKDVFLENFDANIIDKEKENEADEFARLALLPPDIESEFPEKITEKEIRQVARKYNTHPAIVLGRLQYLERVPYTFGTSLKLKIALDEDINKTGDI